MLDFGQNAHFGAFRSLPEGPEEPRQPKCEIFGQKWLDFGAFQEACQMPTRALVEAFREGPEKPSKRAHKTSDQMPRKPRKKLPARAPTAKMRDFWGKWSILGLPRQPKCEIFGENGSILGHPDSQNARFLGKNARFWSLPEGPERPSRTLQRVLAAPPGNPEKRAYGFL